MSLDVKVEVFHKGRITPSSPTPHHLRDFRISFLDQSAHTVYFPIILYYPNSDAREVNNIDARGLVAERTELLKRSLSETLTCFYPLAGRIQDYVSVCCNDEGVMFLEAQVNCPILRALDNPDLDFVKDLLPNLQSADGDFLLVQANFFECGGLAIGFQVSHQIMDAFTFSTFLNRWSATYRGLRLPPYQYVGAASHFPPLELFEPPPLPQIVKFAKEKCTTRRFLFESSKIDCLKSKASSDAVQNPTRVEVVSALIWKCEMKASAANSGSARPLSSAWLQTVNIRKILTPSAENLMGNLYGFSPTIYKKGESADDLQGLVAAMRKGLNALKVEYGANGFGVDDIRRIRNEFGEVLRKDDTKRYVSTSWCRMPFYETDFGWGKPLMSCPATLEIKNLTWLRDTRDGGGITATLTLEEEDMAIFENDEELLAYASRNPSVV